MMSKRDDAEMRNLLHMSLLSMLHKTYRSKNADYGDSATKTFEEFGMMSYALRLTDKLNRFKQLVSSGEQKVADESIFDTLLDLANYSLMAIIDLTSAKKKGGQSPGGK